ncbi:MAG TPA: amidohydrolase family protein [Actinomycetota bacterium]|nr:amidohydrolase family protein [Actinomycetota bacterium]
MAGPPGEEHVTAVADFVLRGGRVVDPASGLDGVRDVAVTGSRITAVSEEPAGARRVVDVSGMVVAPGAIDLHSHSCTLADHRLQATDGVTTVLELEGGASPVARAYAHASARGRPLNYGFSASWAMARMRTLTGHDPGGHIHGLLAHIGDAGWQRPASEQEVTKILDAVETDVRDGALGIGVLVGYAPGTSPDEYLAVARAAARHGVPTFTHARELVEVLPEAAVDGAEEIVRAAGLTGAHMHYCHINSTSGRHIDRVLRLVERARSEGSRVTTEAYPYGAGMTSIGAAFLSPEHLRRRGMSPEAIRYIPTGERVANDERLRELRDHDPGGLAIVESLDEDDPRDRSLLLKGLAFAQSAVASDAIPLTWLGPPDETAWPLPPHAVTHPRTAGTFSRALRVLTGELGLTLLEAVDRTSYTPARILGDSVPAMRSKGRVQASCDADLVVFDPDEIVDRATYEASTRSSAGIRHVLVNGEFVVADGELDTSALPGRPVRTSGAS